jgi:hypothetical protein
VSLKDRFTKALRKKADRGITGYPIATIAFYGPNDKLATKVSVGVVVREGEEPAFLERWMSARDVRTDHEVNEQIMKFIRAHEAKSVAMIDRIIGCPHEEGIDYPEGTKCPECPFWAHRDRWTGEVAQ